MSMTPITPDLVPQADQMTENDSVLGLRLVNGVKKWYYYARNVLLPAILPNGNWAIGGVDTGQPSKAPFIQIHYSVNKEDWHGEYEEGDKWQRVSTDGGVTWGNTMPIAGAVDSVNGKVGEVKLSLEDLNAAAADHTHPFADPSGRLRYLGEWAVGPCEVNDVVLHNNILYHCYANPDLTGIAAPPDMPDRWQVMVKPPTTPAQVGLSNVANERQYSAEYPQPTLNGLHHSFYEYRKGVCFDVPELSHLIWDTYNIGDYVAFDDANRAAAAVGKRLPTQAEFQALLALPNVWDNNLRGCWVAATQADLDSRNLTRCLFLPAVGLRLTNGFLSSQSAWGYYWSSTQFAGNTNHGILMWLYSNGNQPDALDKGSGLSVRCVQDSSQKLLVADKLSTERSSTWTQGNITNGRYHIVGNRVFISAMRNVTGSLSSVSISPLPERPKFTEYLSAILYSTSGGRTALYCHASPGSNSLFIDGDIRAGDIVINGSYEF